MVFDQAHNQDVLFGGANSSGVLGGTFLWNGVTWTKANPTQSPPARDAALMAYDAANSTVVLFGGYDGSGDLADTWVWNGTNWAKQTPATSPPAQSYGAAAYLPSLGEVVIFGGDTYDGATWAWNGTTWTNITPASSPPARDGDALVDDVASGHLLMYGGYTSGTTDNDTWSFDGASWTQLHPTDTPPGLTGATLTYDPTLKRVVLVGGLTSSFTSLIGDYAFDETDWRSAVEPTGLTSRAFAVVAPEPAATSTVPSSGQLVVFGGLNAAGGSTSDVGDTQTYDWPRLGSSKAFQMVTFSVNDKSMVSVNPANGNLVITNTDLNVSGISKNFTLSRSFDSRFVLGNSTFSPGWSYDGLFGEYVSAGLNTGDYYVYGLQGGSTEQFFPKLTTSFQSPAGLNADLMPGTPPSVVVSHASNDTLQLVYANANTYTDVDRNYNTLSMTTASNKISQMTDTHGTTYSTTYDPTTNLLAGVTSAADGRTIGYGYDGSGNLKSFTDAAGNKTVYGYSGGRLTSMTSAEGRELMFTYDAFDRVTGVTQVTGTDGSGNPVGYTTSFVYNSVSASNQSSYPSATLSTLVVAPNQIGTNSGITYLTDHAGQVVQTTDQVGDTSTASFDANTDPHTFTDGLSATATDIFDPQTNNLTSIQAPTTASGATGRATTLAYPAVSGSAPYPQTDYRAASETDSQGNITSFSYDTVGNLQQITNAQSPSTTVINSYQGDGTTTCAGASSGELCKSTDGRNLTTIYTYDSKHRVLTMTPPAPIGPTTYGYDIDNRLASVTDALSNDTTYFYDGDDRVTEVRTDGVTSTTCSSSDAASGACIGYIYDGDGNLTSRLDDTGTTKFKYDSIGRPYLKTLPSGATTQLTYDASSNLTAYTDASGTIAYGYNSANQLTSLAEPGGSCTGTLSLCTTFTYDADGHRTHTFYPSGEKVVIGYDRSGRETSVVAKRPSDAVFLSRTYNYETGPGDSSDHDTDLRQTVTDQAGVKTTYTYDPLNELHTASTAGTTTSYFYDADGNRTSSLVSGSATTYYGYNNANELCWSGATSGSGGTTSCPSPPAGDMGYTYDADGQQKTVGSSLTEAYDNLSRLTTATLAGTATTFTYADIGSSERTAASSGGTTTKFLNALDLGLTAQTTGGTTVSFVRDPNGNLIAMHASNGSNYYVLDALGSVLALTDSSGTNDTAKYTYDAYGQTTVGSGSLSNTNPFRYAGGYYDVGSGLYHFGQRYYSPSTGSWTQLDPSHRTQDYVYAGNSPVNETDPNGEFSIGISGSICLGICVSASISFDPSSGDVGIDGDLGFGSPDLDADVYASTDDVETGYDAGFECDAGPFGYSYDALDDSSSEEVEYGTADAEPSCSAEVGGEYDLGSLY